MGIPFQLRLSSLTTLHGDHVALVCPGQPAGIDEIIARIAEHNTTVSVPDILSVLEDFYVTIEKMLLEGRNVNIPLASVRTSIQGRFNGVNDNFDPLRHRIMPRVVPGSRLRKAIATQAQAIKLETMEREPHPNEYVDVNSNIKDSVLTPAGLGMLRGRRLVFDQADARQGLFFLAADGAETRVEIVGKAMPIEVWFQVPPLSAGSYTLEVRAVTKGSAALHTGRMKQVLTVK
jgi:hypothetical protein